MLSTGIGDLQLSVNTPMLAWHQSDVVVIEIGRENRVTRLFSHRLQSNHERRNCRVVVEFGEDLPGRSHQLRVRTRYDPSWRQALDAGKVFSVLRVKIEVC